jgi:hypothetical protein
MKGLPMNHPRYHALKADCERVRSSANRCWIDYIIEEAAENASFTIQVEKAAPADQWDSLFTGSIGVLLSGGEYNKRVRVFFAVRGITY